VFFKCGNGTFSGVDTVVMWWDQLDVHLVGSDVLLNCLGALVVHHVQCWLVIASMEYCTHFGEGGNEQGIGAGWHWLHDDGIENVDIRDKDTLHVLKRPNGKSTSDVGVIVPVVALARAAKQNIFWTVQASWGGHIRSTFAQARTILV
jgi:hypothetical protein